jgi:hypothetical protein
MYEFSSSDEEGDGTFQAGTPVDPDDRPLTVPFDPFLLYAHWNRNSTGLSPASHHCSTLVAHL